MRTAVLITILGGVLWLWLGSRIVLVFDRCFPGAPSTKDYEPLQIDVTRFAIGHWGFSLPPGAIRLILDSQQRLVLLADQRAFTLGPVKTIWTDPVKPQYEFVPEAGDIVSYTRAVSRLEWHTPFAVSFMVYAPKRHRYAYDRLHWTKASGAEFEIVWREDQRYSPRSKGGWQDEYNFQVSKLTIRPGPVENAAKEYLASKKVWSGDEYRLEMQTATVEDYVVAAICGTDGSHPGGGKSVLLRINKSSGKVAGETGFQ